MKLMDLLIEGKKVKVPTFNTGKQAAEFVKKLNFDDIVSRDVFDPETGEVYMERGYSKKRVMKNKTKNKKAFDRIKDLDSGEYWGSLDKRDLENFYLIKYEDLDKDWSEQERDKMYDAGYDVGVTNPKAIMRRDKKSFSENEVETLRDYAEYFNKDVMKKFYQGIKFELHPQKGKKLLLVM